MKTLEDGLFVANVKMDHTNAIFDILEAAEQSMKILLNQISPVVTDLYQNY